MTCKRLVDRSQQKSLLLLLVNLKARFLSHKETGIYGFETPAMSDQPKAFGGLGSTVGATQSCGQGPTLIGSLVLGRHRGSMAEHT